jgi:phosphinothricin acetyltransferase
MYLSLKHITSYSNGKITVYAFCKKTAKCAPSNFPLSKALDARREISMVRNAIAKDAPKIAEIYNHYIENTVITFEEEVVLAAEIQRRVEEIHSTGLPWLVAESDGQVVGYAYASKWKGRCAYRFSVEVTVYLSSSQASNGWGTKLYSTLFEKLELLKVHSVIGGIALPNKASIALHEKFGMEKVAHFKEIGYKFSNWVDVGYWQKQIGV